MLDQLLHSINLFKTVDTIALFIWPLFIFDSVMYIRDGNYDWRTKLRLVFGIMGLIVDGYLVFFY